MSTAEATTLSRLLTSSLRLARVQGRVKGLIESLALAPDWFTDPDVGAFIRGELREVLDEIAEYQREVRGQ